MGKPKREKKLYDNAKSRLVYLRENATSEFWDKLWDANNIKKSLLSKRARIELPVTKSYLSQGAQILEGGCGNGAKAYALNCAGYNVTGVDFADKTVSVINDVVPELDIQIGDVRKLDFADNSFDGYWSIGVIEHFWDGYDEILSDAYRVLKPGGILFLSFPQMSILRRFKAKIGLYRSIEKESIEKIIETFYQFALSPERVLADLAKLDFHIVKKKGINGFKGIKDEFPLFGSILRFTQKQGRYIPFKVFNKTLDVLTKGCCGHSCLIVAKKG